MPADGGVVVACGDDEQLAALARAAGRTLVTYGFGEGCDARIVSFEPQGVGSDFVLALPDGRQLSAHVKQNPGRHNVLNAAGVIVLADARSAAEAAARAMAGFARVRRRFDLVGPLQDHRGGRLRAPSHRDRRHHRRGDALPPCTCCSSHARYSRVPVLFAGVLNTRFDVAGITVDDYAHHPTEIAATHRRGVAAGLPPRRPAAPLPGVSGKTF